MNKKVIARIRGRIFTQILIQFVVAIVTALSTFFFMTWLVADLLDVRNIYLAAFYETLGTMVMMIIVLVPLNTAVYRRRKRELNTLSNAIQRVAGGDYKARIPLEKAGQMLPIYEDFNKMCAELESVRILRNDFINSYSHEFRTPIASINGFAELLLEKELPEKEQRQYLEIISEESERLTKLAGNTILLSKLSSQQIITDLEEYDLSEQIRQCSIILSKSWMDKKIDFNGEFSSVKYLGNKELMQHLWLNILGNAVKYTPVGGEITVSVQKEGDHVSVIVSDTGEGISEKTLEHLFDPYYQGDSSHSRQGLGLGLSIAQRITELCRGTISVESKVSEGSIFKVTLPLDSPRANSVSEKAAEKSLLRNLRFRTPDMGQTK